MLSNSERKLKKFRYVSKKFPSPLAETDAEFFRKKMCEDVYQA